MCTSGQRTIDHIIQQTREFSMGSQFEIGRLDVISLQGLLREDLISRGFSEEKATEALGALANNNINPIANSLGIVIIINQNLETVVPQNQN